MLTRTLSGLVILCYKMSVNFLSNAETLFCHSPNCFLLALKRPGNALFRQHPRGLAKVGISLCKVCYICHQVNRCRCKAASSSIEELGKAVSRLSSAQENQSCKCGRKHFHRSKGSQGMYQRLSVDCAVLESPRVDFETQIFIWPFLYLREFVTVLLSCICVSLVAVSG